jgi:predicted permease
MLRKRPGTSVLAALALALGIGLTTTMFSIVQGVFLRGLPVPDAGRVVNVARRHMERGTTSRSVPFDDLRDWRAQQQSFTGLAAFNTPDVTLSDVDIAAERLDGARITANTLSVLGIAPVTGRDFNEADEMPGAPEVVLISDDVWRRRYGADPRIAGRTTRVNGVVTSIVGVLPPRFRFPEFEDVWLPFRPESSETRNQGPTVNVIGRLQPGVSADAANRELASIAARLAEQYPENRAFTAITQPFMEAFLGSDVISTLFAMLGAVFGVLLIACANVTNLQLARAAERMREVAIRSALGSSRWRIIRQMAVEGVMLAMAGAAVGVGLAAWAIALFNRGIADTRPPFWIDIRLDPTVLAFVAGITMLAAVVSSVWPAVRVSRTPAADVLKDQSRSSTGLRAGLVTRTLVTVAVAISCGLLIVSGLMIKSVAQLAQREYPFETRSVLEARLSVVSGAYAEPVASAAFVERVHAALLAMPGVRAAALSTSRPGSGATIPILMEDAPIPTEDADVPRVMRAAITPGFFDTIGVGLAEGRDFTAADADGSVRVAVVDGDLAREHFPGGALGRRLRLGREADSPLWTIVGVVPPLAAPAQDGQVTATAYVPLAQLRPGANVQLLLGALGAPEALAEPARRAVMGIDRDAAVSDARSLEASLYQQGWPSRVFGGLFASFGVAALIMATAGLYGVLAFAVRRRTPEIGVRMALGAGRGQVLRLILKQGLLYVGIGLVVGTGIGALLGPLMGDLLWRVEPYDLGVFGTTIGVLAVTGLVASLVPALRAASVEPLVALRHE